MTALDKSLEKLSALNPDALLADGLEEAYIGMTTIYSEDGDGRTVACYSENKVIDILRVRDGMPFREAIEFFDVNIATAYMGENQTIFVDVFSPE